MLIRKILIPASALIITFFIGLNWSSIVGTQDPSINNKSAVEHAQLHTDPTYVCPMHPQVTDTEASACPICGMDLELREISSPKESALEHAERHTDPTYVCPMHSQITDTEASACPICGMDLELRETSTPNGNANASSDSVYVSPAMMNNLSVRLVHLEKGPVFEQVYATGYVEKVSDAQAQTIVSKVNGMVHEILVEDGDWVEEDQVLIRINVEGYYESMLDYIDAMENGKIRKGLKLRNKFEAMGAGASALAAYDDSDTPLSKYLEILAPFAGEVSGVFAKDGAIQKADNLVTITAPALAEANLRSYSYHARSIEVGNEGVLSVAHLKGRTWKGRVTEITHNFEGFFTSITFHVEVTPGVLEVGAFAGAYIGAKGAENVLRVPSSAVIHDSDSVRVIRMTDDNHFEAVDVEVGFEGDSWTEIKSGLNEDDHIVSRGQFLIDSETTLQAGFKRLSE